MRIFFSHASSDKPLIREICSHFPQHVKSWVDEDELLIGGNITASIREAISESSDFVVLIVGMEAGASEWVRRELEWALKKEKELGRVFLLPIVVDMQSWNRLLPKSEHDRKYLRLQDFSRASVKSLSEKLVAEIFARVSKHLEEEREASSGPKMIVEMVALTGPEDNYLEKLRDQGAPEWALERANQLLGSLAGHTLVVRCKNTGNRSVLIDGYGIEVSQEGKRTVKRHPYAPDSTQPLPIDFEPGDYNEFQINLDTLAIELQNEILGFSGRVKIMGFYSAYDGREFRSDAAWLDVETSRIDFVRP